VEFYDSVERIRGNKKELTDTSVISVQYVGGVVYRFGVEQEQRWETRKEEYRQTEFGYIIPVTLFAKLFKRLRRAGPS
jgi:hypothetical protein